MSHATASDAKAPGPPSIHPTSVVDRDAELAPGVVIGPLCSITGRVRLGPGVRLLSRVCIQGPATIGAGTVVYPNACLGLEPQDYKFKPGTPTAGIAIGRDCLIREGVTVHAATTEQAPTTIGDRVFMMVNAHAGHDARVENDVILVNGALLAGHTLIQERAIISGNSCVHQFCSVGRLAFATGAIAVAMSVPPFCMCGERNTLNGLNIVGMRRSGMDRDHISRVRIAFREVFWVSLPRQEMIQRLTELGADCPPVMEMAEFVRASKRPIARGTASHAPEDEPTD